jgi:hypothetical protein
MFDTLEDHPMAIFHAAEQATVTEIRWLAWRRILARLCL